ncbi:MAG: TorF family putative porin, partial [Gammaproteobacteria bacterium]|nr:TorF family putative porin [Gammaproteobacteria bacterium]
MPKTFKTVAALAALSCMGTAQAEVSANLGFNSDYIFRGVPQAESSANGGFDFEKDGFYLGTWAAAVKPGLEVDIYGGYRYEWDNGLNLGAGFTG